MTKNKLLKILYTSAFSPLIIGSLVFYYWYHNLFNNAIDLRIEGKALIIVLSYFILSIVTIITSIVILVKHRELWRIIIIPLICVFITFPVIELYERYHTTMSDVASFIKIKRDVDEYKINRIWSDNFERTYFDTTKVDFVFHYFPVRNYDWTPIETGYDGDSFIDYNYEISQLYIDLIKKDKDTITYKLSKLDKGEDDTISISELLKTNPNKVYKK
jgi:hypothetical protein